MTMNKEEFLNWIINHPNVDNIYKNYVRENPDISYATYLDQAGVEIPVRNQKPIQKQPTPAKAPKNVLEKVRDFMGYPGSPWYNKYFGGQATGGAAQVTPYDESLNKIAFNSGFEDLRHLLSGESEAAQAERLQNDNIQQRQYIDSNYMRYPQFYRDIINPGYEKDIQDRRKYIEDRGLNL